MRTYLIASAAAVALFTVAGAAQAQVVGYAGANYARVEAELAGFEAEDDVFQAEAAAAFDAGSFRALVDGQVSDSDNADPTWAATGHLNTDLGGARVGAFAGVVTNDGDTLWAGGVEGQADLAASTVLYGQLGYGKSDDLDVDGWAVRAEVRQYVTEGFRVSGSLGYVTADQDLVGDLDAWTMGAEAEYQFTGTPMSVFAAYDRADFNDIDLESNTFKVGVRFSFGGATLRGRDAAGAQLGNVSKLFGGLFN
jgi:hypothetical protein